MKNNKINWIVRILLDITLVLAIIYVLLSQDVTDSLIVKVLLVVSMLPIKYILGYFLTKSNKKNK